jgi:hypothetical protein
MDAYGEDDRDRVTNVLIFQKKLDESSDWMGIIFTTIDISTRDPSFPWMSFV